MVAYNAKNHESLPNRSIQVTMESSVNSFQNLTESCGIMYETANQFWKNKCVPIMEPDWASNIDAYEKELFLNRQGKIEDKIFAETRLRMGAYGQRYDNGTRNNGKDQVAIPFPDPQLKKGVDTFYHAPGMVRVKLPFGRLSVEQMYVLADLAEEYSDTIVHITTRQDVQLHYVHIDDTPAMFRRLAAVGITTQEACGNSVRNITGCPIAGVCSTEAFDISPYADVLFRFLLGHPDAQDFGRKFKIAFSGCIDKPCGLTNMHDLGLIAKIKKDENGKEIRGFGMVVGGGLGAVPYPAQVFSEFIPVEQFLPTIQAICRVYARLGEKKKRHMARIKFLVVKLGIDALKEEVQKELSIIKPDPRWTSMLPTTDAFWDSAKSSLDAAPMDVNANALVQNDARYEVWKKHNVSAQVQKGYSVVTINLPLGDCTAQQFRALADVCAKHCGNTVRATVEQNLVLRWVREIDLPSLYISLKKVGMAYTGAGTVTDITSCPGTDTCKLGIASSRALSAVLMKTIEDHPLYQQDHIRTLKIKVSGCFNSCGQHHLADIGFYGISRIYDGYTVPHFQLSLGGEFAHNGRTYGLAIGGFPSKAIPTVVDKLFRDFDTLRQTDESFTKYLARRGKKEILTSLKEYTAIPAYAEKPEFYTDWGDVREFTLKDKGVGECAGEVVSLTDFGLKRADREYFEAQLLLDEDKHNEAAEKAFQAMLHAAQALCRFYDSDTSDDPSLVYDRFKIKFYDTGLILDPFGGDRFVQYYFNAHEHPNEKFNADGARIRVEEARLFVEAARSAHVKLGQLETKPTK